MSNNMEAKVLDAIEDYINQNGFSPSIREIGDKVGLKSSSTVHRYLKLLEDRGSIERLENCPRALKIIRN